MERKVGDKFNFRGVELYVCSDGNVRCSECYLYLSESEKRCDYRNDRIKVGPCSSTKRKDKTSVIFRKVKNN